MEDKENEINHNIDNIEEKKEISSRIEPENPQNEINENPKQQNIKQFIRPNERIKTKVIQNKFL